MKIALLGHNGFVGKNVVEEFNKQNIAFFPVSRQLGFNLKEKKDNINFIKESGCSIIINCAAHVGSLNYVTEKAADIVNDNTQMILALYESIKEVDPSIIIIQPVANCAFPSSAFLFKEEELWNGPLHSSVMSYGLTRRFIIAASECYRAQYGINSINLYTPNMYGPFDSTDPNKAHALNALVYKFLKASKGLNSNVDVWGSGIAIREWLYAKDFARILANIVMLSDKAHLYRPVNIAQNWGVSIKELVDLITHSFNYKGQVSWDQSKPDGALKKVMDDTVFRKIFPDFKFTSMEKGIKETTEFYSKQYIYSKY